MIASLEEFESACNCVAEILSRYNNSRNILIYEYDQWQRLVRRSGSQVNRDHSSLVRLEALTGHYEQAHLDEIQSQLHCNNSHRHQCSNNHNVEGTSSNNAFDSNLVTICGDAVCRGSRTYKFCSQSSDSSVYYTLYRQCKDYLCSSDIKEFNQIKGFWPLFMWSILSSREVHKHYGSDVWRFVPKAWWIWWLNILRSMFSSIFDCITMGYPSPAFLDCTKENSFCSDIDPTHHATIGLQKLQDACNNHLLPTVLCPFGCMEYMHKCNHLSLVLIFQRYLPRVRLLLPSSSFKANL